MKTMESRKQTCKRLNTLSILLLHCFVTILSLFVVSITETALFVFYRFTFKVIASVAPAFGPAILWSQTFFSGIA